MILDTGESVYVMGLTITHNGLLEILGEVENLRTEMPDTILPPW